MNTVIVVKIQFKKYCAKVKPSSAHDEFNVSSGGGVLTFRHLVHVS